jgi:pimeloyl-ACP methyl ester carboxylesterase
MHSIYLGDTLGHLRYHDLPGEGVPIVFVHGLGCASSCDYPRVSADRALAGRRKLLVDLLGSGFSDRPRDFGYTVDEHAETLVKLMDGLDVAAVDLFGHSMGGAVAIVAASLRPGMVRRLVLGEPNLEPGGGTFSAAIASFDEETYVTRGHHAVVRGARIQGHDIWASSLLLTDPRAAHRSAVSLVAGSAPTWRDQLVALPMPRTVLFGEKSLPDPDAELLSRLGVTVRIIRGAGHAMAFENPSGLAEALAHVTRQG